MSRSAALFCLLLAVCPLEAGAAPKTDAQVIAQVGFAPPLNAELPALRFTGGSGALALRELLAQGPSLLTFAWFECRNLCGLILNGLADSSGRLLAQGPRDFRVIVVSMDAAADRAQADAQRRHLARQYPNAAINSHWHFLTGDAAAIEQLAAALGYRFTYDQRKRQYAHPAGVVAVAPSGRIRDYRSGVNYRAEDIDRLLQSAAAAQPNPGRANPILLLCYDYDPGSGRYSLAIMKLLRVVAVLALLLFGGAIWYWQRKNA